MERRTDRFIMLAVGAVAGIAMTLLFKTPEAMAQVRMTPFRVCVGTTWNPAQGHLYRLWNDGTADYTTPTTSDGNGTYHFAPWRPVQP